MDKAAEVVAKAAAGATAGVVSGAVVGAVGGPVGAAVVGVLGGVSGGLLGAIAGLFDQPNVKLTSISVNSWRAVWNNASKKLEEMEEEKYACEKQSDTYSEETRSKSTRYDYQKAIQKGTEIMSCGRVEIIGEASERLRRELLPTPAIAQGTTGTTQGSAIGVYTICNETLCPMTEEEEQKGLATLANKVMERNSEALLKKKIADSFHKPLVFSSSSDGKGTGDKIIIDIIKKIVQSTLEQTSSKSCESITTPVLIHTTNHRGSWKLLKHILPILITSRTFFLIAINSDQNQDDTITVEEDVCHCITSIIDALSEKAKEQFALLKREGVAFAGDNNTICPYPKVVVVGTYTSDEQHTKLKSTTGKIQKWVNYYFPDSVQYNFKAIVVNASDEMKPVTDYIQTIITKFITRDLQMHIPLSWELFRQIFSYLAKNVPFLQLEVVATIASLCDIPTEEFPSVLNFYHEHGAFQYYPDVKYLNDIIIIDPNWLETKLQMVLTPTADQSSPIWEWHKKGILIAPHCENPEKIEKLQDGLMMLLEKYRLAAPVHINQEICDCEGTKYFVPFVLKSKGTSQPLQKKSKLHTAPLHFIFPEVKHLPSGVFTKLSVALASIDPFEIDFKSDMFSNQITYWFETHDKVILSASLTSIYVVVERLKYCGDDYPASNFGSTCQKIFRLLTTEIQKSFKTSCPAFCCKCLPEGLPHYVNISTDTVNTCDTLRCGENKIYTINGCEQLWLKMAAPSFRDVRKLYGSEINKLVESLKVADLNTLTDALEMEVIDGGTDCKDLIIWWSKAMGAEARKHLMYHLNRLGLAEAAQAINRGRYCDKGIMEREQSVRETFQKFYAEFEKSLNPDDITAKLFSQGIITEIEIAEINSQKTTRGKIKALLDSLERAIDIDYHNFTKFLNTLGKVGKYKPLIDRIDTQFEQYAEHDVTATAAAGDGDNFSSVSEDALVPSPPIGLKACKITTTSIAISWQPPHDGIIRGYQLSYTPHGESECLHDVFGDTASTELTSLKPHTEYTIRVRAKTVDFGDYSTPITVSTLEDDLFKKKISAILNNYKDITFKQLRIIKLIFYGTPRAGKTTLRRQLLTSVEDSLQPSSATFQPSTNVAEICDHVFVERIVMTSEENNVWRWTIQKLDDIAKTLLQCLDNQLIQCKKSKTIYIDAREEPNVTAAQSPTPVPLMPLNQYVQDKQMDGTPEYVPPSQIVMEKEKNHVQKTMLPIFKQDKIHASTTDLDIQQLFSEAVKTGQWSEVVSALNIDRAILMQVIDGGGQPSFQEIFPLLISGPSVTLLMFKLTDDLQKAHDVQYQPVDGVEHTWKDTYVVRDFIFHAISSIVPFAEDYIQNPFGSKILLVGTHKDKIKSSEGQKKAEIMKIAKSMHGWLRELKAFKSIHVKNFQDLVTGIDNFNQQDIQKVKNKIEKLVSQTPSQDIPAPWLVFDFVLHAYDKSKKLRKVEKIKCEQIAKKCGVKDEEIEVVLQYLHYEAGTLLYYSDIPELRDCVITDFQLIFDSISKIIIDYFDDSSDHGPHIQDKLQLHEKGQLEASVLKDVEGCLKVNELLSLMQHRHIISKMDGDMFFMPSVLPKAEPSYNKSGDSCSFLVMFEHGCCPIGLFCAVTTSLIVTHKWRVKKDETQFRDKISLYCYFSGKSYHIIFLAFFAHFEICVTDRKAERNIRYPIYKVIDKVFKTVCKDMNYPPPSYGFYCPKMCTYGGVTHLQNEHPAKCDMQAQEMTCYYSDAPSDLTEEHKSWFREVQPQEQINVTMECDYAVTHVPLSLDSEPSLPHLMDRVAAVIPHKFETVGLQLGLTLGELQVIGPHHPSLEDHRRAYVEMLGVWRRRGSPPYTWRTIIGVLSCASVGEILLSEQLTSWIIEGSGDQ